MADFCISRVKAFDSLPGDGKTLKGGDDHHHEVHFYLLHAPIEVLYNAAEDLKMKMPTKPNDIDVKKWYESVSGWKSWSRVDPFKIKRKGEVNFGAF